MIAQLMRDETEPLVQCKHALFGDNEILRVGVSGDRIGDGIVEAAVQRTKLIDLNRFAELRRQFGDGLAQVAIVMHDLIDRESVLQQFTAMIYRRALDLREV